MIEARLRNALPKCWQSPIKYLLNRFQGILEFELSLPPQLLRLGEHALNVGANRVIYTYVSNICFEEDGVEVDAFEPNLNCIQLLLAWFREDPGLCAYNVALCDHSSRAKLHIPIDAIGIEHDASSSLLRSDWPSARPITASLETLDCFKLVGISFIKIDVEGAEAAVLRGWLQTLMP